MTGAPLPTPARVLAVGAHPDDVEFGCGATLARWSGAGAHCEILVLTDGSKGTWDPDADIAALVRMRQEEQRAAAAALGVATVHFGHAVDGELENTVDTRREVCRVIRAARPDVVLGHDPWKRYRLHPDHHAAGRLVIDGIVAARDPHYFPDAGLPHRPSALLLFEAEEVDHVELADPVTQRAKLDALLAHGSQWRPTMGIDRDAPGDEPARQRAAFEHRVLGRLVTVPGDESGRGEPFKLLTDL
jgi:LmbE family N-acetylglucosaminyl deacetylase